MLSFTRTFRISFRALSFRALSLRALAVFTLLYAGQVLAQPSITSFTPTSAVPGASITITGSGFNATIGSNAVHFGGVRATVTAATVNSLTVTVPTAAAYGRVSVVNTGTGLGDVSRQMFLPTFTPTLGRALKTSDFVMTTTTGGVMAYAMAPIDLNADGKLDIVLTTYTSDNITYRLNTSTLGSISFGAETAINVAGFAGMQDIDVGDLDGDGLLDIVATSEAADKFVVLRQSGSLSFTQTPIDTGDAPQSVALADVDNDGKLDVVVAHSNAATGVHMYRNTTVGSTISFGAAETFVGTIGSGTSMTVADFNADGKDDVLIARNGPRKVTVMENTSAGVGVVSFTTSTEVDLLADSFPNYITTAELDGDGKIDAVVPFGNIGVATTAGILANTSGANISFTRDLTTLASAGAHQDTAALGDLTGDGKPDLVLPLAVDADGTGGFLYNTAVYTNTSTSGNIGFSAKIELGNTSVSAAPRASLVADLDGDNRPDLLVYYTNSGSMVSYRNTPVLTPATQATDVQAPSASLLPTSASISWTRGSGQRIVMFVKQTSSTSDVPAPVDLTTYSASSTFGAGDQLGTTGWYAVANGTGTSATVTGLTQNTAYRVMVIEYTNNSVAGAEAYQTASATGNPLNFTTPVPVAITSLVRASASPTNAATVNYTLTLGGSVFAGLSAGRFSLTTTGTVAGASVGTVTGSGTTWTVPVNTGTGEGNITLRFNNATGIVPGISTTLPFTGETYVIDKTAPTLTSVTIASSYTDPAWAIPGNLVTVNFTSSATINTPTVTIAGRSASVSNAGGNNWTAVYTLAETDAPGRVPFQISYSDSAGNSGSVAATTNGSSVTYTIPPAATPVDPGPPPPPNYAGPGSNVNITGPVTIPAGTVIIGGHLSGLIINNGAITGTVTLGPGTTLDGGTVSGVVRGDPPAPAVFVNVSVPAGTRLEYVYIGRDTVLSPGAILGAGVRFDARHLIPPGIDLTNTLAPFRWSGSAEFTVVDLGRDVLRVPRRSILDALQLLPGQPSGSEFEQNANGELVLHAQGTRGMLLPVRVRQAAADVEAGTYVDGNGNLIFVTEEGHEILVYPVLMAAAAFDGMLAERGLDVEYEAQAGLLVKPAHGRFFYAGKPGTWARPVPSGSETGLRGSASGYAFVFRDDDGTVMEQELVPVPANWPALRDALALLPGVSDVALDTAGDINVEVKGRRVRGRVSHRVSRSIADLVDNRTFLIPAGDLNGDGTGDFYVMYPGDVVAPGSPWVQELYVAP